MDAKWLIDPDRIRKITGSFSWIDHRFISGGFIRNLSREEILIYFFLVAVADRQGLSFYHDDRICSLLKIDPASLGEARESLVARSLIAWRSPIYQVLALPPQPINPLSPEERVLRQRRISLTYLKKLQEVIA